MLLLLQYQRKLLKHMSSKKMVIQIDFIMFAKKRLIKFIIDELNFD